MNDHAHHLIRGTGRRHTLSEARWVHMLILALPFVIVVVGWHGLTGSSMNGFQAGDEPVHYAIVQTVMHQWPRPLLSGYGAWSGPLFYWLLAGLSLPFGGNLAAVRLVVTAFSWGTCAIAYVLFRDRLHARPPDALALALLLAVSPFFFGQSFHVLTDNPTWFFVVLALERLLAYTQRPGAARLAAFAACLVAATLMRHITLWLLLPGLTALLSTPVPRRQRVVGLVLIALGVVPIMALLLYWGGPLPPDPHSGAAAATPLAAGYRMRNLLLSLGAVGWYSIFMIPFAELAAWRRRARQRRIWIIGLVFPAVAAAVLLAFGALGTITSFLSLISRFDVPKLAGVSLLWWLFIPLGAAATAALLTTRLSEVRSRLLVSVLLGVLVSAMANPRWFERYVDFPILLVFAGLAVAAGVPLVRTDRERWLVAGLVAIASLLWFL